MSAENVQQILTRAVAEPEFRGRLLADPSQALGGYDLTPAEAAALSHLSAEEFDAAVSALETRESRASFDLGQIFGQPTGFPAVDGQPRQPIGY